MNKQLEQHEDQLVGHFWVTDSLGVLFSSSDFGWLLGDLPLLLTANTLFSIASLPTHSMIQFRLSRRF